MIKKVLLTAALILISTHSFAANAELSKAEKQVKNALDKAQSVRLLPNSKSMIAFGTNGEAIVIADNPRWVVKGTLYDMWSKKEVRSISTLSATEKRIPLDTIKVDSTNILDVVVNPEKSLKVTIFLDPFAENSSEITHILTKYASDYQLRFILTAHTEENLKKLSSFNCILPKLEAEQVIKHIIDGTIPVRNQSCMSDKLVNGFALARFVGIKQSPTLIAPNEVYNVGLPPKLMSWIAENTDGE